MNTLGWDDLVGFLRRAQIRRLLWQGIWDGDARQRQFHTMTSPVYLDSDIGMLKVATIINDSFLSFELVKEPTWELFAPTSGSGRADSRHPGCECRPMP